MEQQEYERLLVRIKEELNHPLADSYHIIVSLLHYLLMILNRRWQWLSLGWTRYYER